MSYFKRQPLPPSSNFRAWQVGGSSRVYRCKTPVLCQSYHFIFLYLSAVRSVKISHVIKPVRGAKKIGDRCLKSHFLHTLRPSGMTLMFFFFFCPLLSFVHRCIYDTWLLCTPTWFGTFCLCCAKGRVRDFWMVSRRMKFEKNKQKNPSALKRELANFIPADNMAQASFSFSLSRVLFVYYNTLVFITPETS